MWYGLWFALGFILAYLLIIKLFTSTIHSLSYITEKQVDDWTLLICQLKEGIEKKDLDFLSIFDSLSSKQKKKLTALSPTSLPDFELKESIIEAINRTIQNRSKVVHLFPSSVETASSLARLLADRLSWYAVIGTVIGARLGHVIFYDLHHYVNNPLSIFKTWEGGLASHGGTLGLLAAMFFYHKFLKKYLTHFSFLMFLDIFSVVVPVGCVCIRIGNFFNQEILGPPTLLPWGIIFGHPFDHEAVIPRHPAQLYEAVAYFLTFIIVFILWQKNTSQRHPGFITGILFICIFTFRFFIEFLKMPQGGSFEGLLQTGQVLSIPFILLGIAFIYFSRRSCLDIQCKRNRQE